VPSGTGSVQPVSRQPAGLLLRAAGEGAGAGAVAALPSSDPALGGDAAGGESGAARPQSARWAGYPGPDDLRVPAAAGRSGTTGSACRRTGSPERPPVHHSGADRPRPSPNPGE